jgi:Fe-S-cluster containining protein
MYDRRYFFDKGLRFTCTQCGKCCRGAPGTIYVSAHEVTQIAGFLKMPEDAFLREYCKPFSDSYTILEHADGRCLFYEAGCTLYPVRPKQCRTFPFWFENVRSVRAWALVERDCPGIGQGRLYSSEEIIAIAGQSLSSSKPPAIADAGNN